MILYFIIYYAKYYAFLAVTHDYLPQKVIYLFPVSKTEKQRTVGEHFETAAKNRGVRINVYYNYDEGDQPVYQNRNLM